MSESELLLEIQQILSAVEWSPDTLSAIAELMEDNGYHIEDIDNGP